MNGEAQELRILREQLRLVLGNVWSSVLPVTFVAIFLYWALAVDENRIGLLTWAAAMLSSKFFAAWDARRYLSRELAYPEARALVRRLMVMHAIDGFIWGALTWPTLDYASVAGSTLVFAVIAGGVIGNAMSHLSPLLPVFMSFLICMLTAVVTKLLSLDDAGYHAIAFTGVVYVFSLYGQSRNNSLATRRMIEMRFENEEMVERLRREKETAAAARAEAEQANAAKSKFLAAASHDLRQPIHAQGLFLEVLAGTKMTPLQREIVANVRAAWMASGEMLNTLLDFSRIEAGVLQPQMQPFRLGALINKIENELAPQADAKGLIYRSRECEAVVWSDPALVELILRNLVSNAIRYTERGGVLVGCRRRGEQVVLEVWDTGIGIDPAQHQEVFREFHQLGNPERDRRKGLGLGLAITDGLARLLGLRLTLASQPGRGSVFRIVLPLAAETLAVDRPALPLVIPFSPAPLHLHVLVIDDDEAVREGMRRLLEGWGCACVVCESLEEALLLAEQRSPDLVISDYRLREQQSGADVIAALRARSAESLPALLITGDTAPERLREAQSRGIPLLHKPVSPVQLYRRMVELTERPAV